ncbi:MAG TPA: hypothetical protein VF175_16665 [Lacipirellula sp.]
MNGPKVEPSGSLNPALYFEIRLHEASENLVELHVQNISHGSGNPSPIVGFTGSVYGPVSKRSRTLPTHYTLMPERAAGRPQQLAYASIPEPCYWNTERPVLYSVQFDIEYADGSIADWGRATGLRRLEVHGSSLLQDRKRTVLRGAVAHGASELEIMTAQKTWSALLVPEPSLARLRDANELGVNLAVDLRGVLGDLSAWLLDLTWHPSVAAVLVDRNADVSLKPSRLLLCEALDAAADSPDKIAPWADLIAFELEPGQRPPLWAKGCRKPIIAIRRGRPCDDLSYARRAADLMQAELAPDFDLAGYFAADAGQQEHQVQVMMRSHGLVGQFKPRD